MRRIASLVIAMMFSMSAFAVVNGNEVAYVGGSAVGLRQGDIGTLDTTSPTELVFVASSGRVTIPYRNLIRADYTTEVAHHLGVAPAIVVGLIKRRERKHFFTFSYTDEAGVGQAAVFEVSKNAPQALLALLKARTPKTCLKLQSMVSCQTTLNQSKH